MKLVPGQEIGPYRVIEQVGRGGMAVVYKAHQASLARYVAIKILPDYVHDDPEFEKRFQAEAVAVASLRHPNIPAVFDYGQSEGVAYIATEFIDGGTLADQLGKPLPADYVTRVLGPVASALDYAHARGVLHRDVKPANILLARDGRPLLNDFGLARMMETHEPRLTVAGQIMGTPEYMAPEQCQGEDIGPPADLYALAVVVYQMLTGRVPFTAATPAAILIAQVHDPLPPPRSINPAITLAIEEALMSGLAKNPTHRYRTAGDLLDAIGRAAASPGVGGPPRDASTGILSPALAAPPSPSPAEPSTATAAPAGRPARRLVAAAAVAVLLVLLALGGLWLLAAHRPGGAAAPAGAGSQASPPPTLDRGELVWAARLDGSASDLTAPASFPTSQAASATAGNGKLDLAVLQSNGRVELGCGMRPNRNFVGEVVVAIPRGSDVHFIWVLRRADAATGKNAVVIDFSGTRGTMQLEVRPVVADRSVELQGNAIPVPGLSEGQPVTVDAISAPSETRIFLNKEQVMDYSESETEVVLDASMGLGIYGQPGSAVVTAVREYQVTS